MASPLLLVVVLCSYCCYIAHAGDEHGFVVAPRRSYEWDKNGTDIFRPYSKPNLFRGVEICPYPSADIKTSDTVSASEYSNRIFMMSISNRIISDIVDTIRI